MHFSLYLRQGMVFVPTTGRVLPGGPYRDMEPVAVAPLSNPDAVSASAVVHVVPSSSHPNGSDPTPRHHARSQKTPSNAGFLLQAGRPRRCGCKLNTERAFYSGATDVEHLARVRRLLPPHHERPIVASYSVCH